MHPCDPPQEREDGLHILAPPAQRAVELVEDQKARLQALQKMIDLIAGAGQAAPARGLWRAQSGQDAGIEMNRPVFTGGQNSRRIAHYGTCTKEEDLEAVFT